MNNNNLSSDVNNVICEAVGCFTKAKFKVLINVGTKGTISLYLCEDCKPRFCSDENNHGKNGQALELVGGPDANAIHNAQSNSKESVQRK